MATPNSNIRISDGQFDFSSGVDSGRPTTIAGPLNPHGIKRTQLCWLVNGTVRGGGVLTRTGYAPRIQGASWSGLFQGAYMYHPIDDSDPYAIVDIGGNTWKINLSDYSYINLSTTFGKFLPANQPLYHFVQAENYLVIQAGDLITKPLFWDGGSLTESRGYISKGNNQNQIPPAGPMDYYMNRIWYARGRKYIAGDILGGTYSILSTTENPLALSGDGLSVPSQAGNIRMLAHTAELDTSLGQGRLLIGTPTAIYRCNVPVTRDDWSDPNFNNAQPLQTVAQLRYGPVSDRSAVVENGDLFYQTLEPAIRSLTYAIRYFAQWGNTPISRNVNRALRFNDRSLLRYSSGIEFSNRLLQTVLPFQTPVGVAHKGILPLDFDLISTLEEKLPPAWEGMLEGVDILQMIQGDFGGLQRAFAFVVSRTTGGIELWEITDSDRFDAGDRRIQMVIETPSFTWGDTMQLKELETMELWFDKMLGVVSIEAFWKPDSYPCWIFWRQWDQCTAKDCDSDASESVCYPNQLFCEAFKATAVLPKPPTPCIKVSGRPANQAYQFQIKLVIKGWCRLRGLMVYALKRDKGAFEGIIC